MLSQESILILAKQLQLGLQQVQVTIKLQSEACTTPFIARYRKEATGGLDEVAIEAIRTGAIELESLEKRKAAILSSIDSQGKLSADLRLKIENCWSESVLEDLYLPYKPKRKTKASVARERGLEPLAKWLMLETYEPIERKSAPFVKGEVTSVEDALQGARDIIAEWISEDAGVRLYLRNSFEKHGVMSAKMVKGKEVEGAKYRDYFAYNEPIIRCPSHRLLALFRGEEEGFIRLSLEPDEERVLADITRNFVHRKTNSGVQIELAVKDAYKRLLAPSIENEVRKIYKQRADEEAINVFAENVKQLLLSAPLGSKRILAIDPGFRSGCKVVCLNEEGVLLHDMVVYPHEPQRQVSAASDSIRRLVQTEKIEAIAIGNGTAGRETEEWIRALNLADVNVFMVNENGASIYSASAIGREEFPTHDITVRGAVSIGRRLADPLAELVKIDAKSIGVGQYQHDVDQARLKQKLDAVVESCVNLVGVNVNTASKSLLTYVSGLNAQLAQNILAYRAEHGAFRSRSELKKVPRLGAKAFEQSAAFLRIPGAKNVLDNTAVHPESYALVDEMALSLKVKVGDLLAQEALRKQVKLEAFVNEVHGHFTLRDILEELAKPGRDPREKLVAFEFSDVKKPEDLYEGMVLPGIVTNITRFGCFVDIGVKQDGMVHISQLANRYVSDPNTIVKLQQQVQVKVLEVDLVRKRISLSMLV
ncbi:MAG: Tex family protein [bacterium]|nr:Tex family protein [bacterium]